MKSTWLKRSFALCLSAVFALNLAACTAPKDNGKTAEETPAATEQAAQTNEETSDAASGGVFEGVGKGNNGDIKVAVTLSDEGKIEKVEILDHAESPSISDLAIERIPVDIVENQSVAVDTISGATMTSNGIIEAVTVALGAAGVDISLFNKQVEASAEDTAAVEKDTEVVVIGAGGAGLSAAVSAHQNGAKVIVLEKMANPGGNTIISGAAYNSADPERQKNLPAEAGPEETIQGLIKAESANDTHKELQEALKKEYEEYKASGSNTLFDSPTLHALQTFEGGDRVGDIELIKNFTANTLGAIQWIEGIGMGFTEEIFTVLGGLWPRAHRPEKPLGTGYIETLSQYCKDNDIEILVETEATDLVTDESGRVIGIVGKTAKGAPVTINASKGVIIATGGFGRNVEMRQEYNKQWATLDESILSTNHPGATGDGITMAQKVGTNLVGMEHIQLLPAGDPVTGSLSGNIEQGVEDRIFVNKEGNRFVAEDARRDVMTQALYEQPDATMWIVVDKHSYETDDVKNNFNESIGELVSAGRAFKADTLEDLAQQIGVDPANLVKAVEEFNKSVESKEKDSFGRTLYANKIDTPPFYAGARRPTVHHTMGGIQIDTACRAISTSGQPVPGLYAAGEVTGGIHGTNRLGGNALPDTMVHGKIAGESVAAGK